MDIKIPDNDHDKEFAELAVRMCEIKFDATKRYGPQTNTLGPKGAFNDLARKYHRIKRDVWEDCGEMTSEKIEDTLLDCAAYALLLLMSLIGERSRNEYP